jgi:hypothetical protein
MNFAKKSAKQIQQAVEKQSSTMSRIGNHPLSQKLSKKERADMTQHIEEKLRAMGIDSEYEWMPTKKVERKIQLRDVAVTDDQNQPVLDAEGKEVIEKRIMEVPYLKMVCTNKFKNLVKKIQNMSRAEIEQFFKLDSEEYRQKIADAKAKRQPLASAVENAVVEEQK